MSRIPPPGWQPPEDGRDFRGYFDTPSSVRWPHGARVAVSFVLNVEEGAELALSSGDERNESIYEVTQELAGYRDRCMEGHFEYGARVGYRRIVETLARHGAVCTLNASARALERTPWIARDAIARGHEIMCHGWRWEDQHDLAEGDERRLISACVESIERSSGFRPVGWHVRSHVSENTRRLLVEEGGFLHDSSSYNDDTPYLDTSCGGDGIVVLPYAFDTNDMGFFGVRRFVRAADFSGYCADAFDWLHREGLEKPVMMTIGLHTRIIGRPGRIAGLETFLRHLRENGGAWIARRDAIATFWKAAHEAQ